MIKLSLLFQLRASLGHPGSLPGNGMVPRPPQEPPGPPGRQFVLQFVNQLLMPVFDSCCCFVGLFSLILVERRTKNKEQRTKNEVGTVAEMARRATG